MYLMAIRAIEGTISIELGLAILEAALHVFAEESPSASAASSGRVITALTSEIGWRATAFASTRVVPRCDIIVAAGPKRLDRSDP